MPLRLPSLAQFRSGVQERNADLWILLPSLVIALVFVLWMAPLLPLPTGNSAAYVALAGYRPPLHGWMVTTGGLERLPLAQLILLGCAVAVFISELGRLLRSPVVPVLAAPLILLQPAVYDSSRWLLTESSFVALMLLGLAMHCRYARRVDMAPLLAAAFDRRTPFGAGRIP